MHRNGSWMIDAGRLGEVVLLSCGGLVDKYVNSSVESIKIYTQNPQTIIFKVNNQKLIPNLHTANKHFLHTIFIHFISVVDGFYTKSTIPITTTNYLIKKGI